MKHLMRFVLELLYLFDKAHLVSDMMWPCHTVQINN